MKKKVLMSLLLLIAIGTSAVFAQEPTLDKLKFDLSVDKKFYVFNAKDRNISGEVVIPDTYNGLPVTSSPNSTGSGFSKNTKITGIIFPNTLTHIAMAPFEGCTGLTSITIPASLISIEVMAFKDCTNLTSVTFLGGSIKYFQPSAFPGDLRAKYLAGGAGTYTRTAGGAVWTKQAGAPPAPAPAVNTSLNGVWRRGNNSQWVKITINGNGGIITSLNITSAIWNSAVSKGYVKVGSTQFWRSLTSMGNLKWSGQELQINWSNSNKDVATGTSWANVTFTMSADGQTITLSDGTTTYKRQK